MPLKKNNIRAALANRTPFILLCVGIVIRFIYLNADPYYSVWLGYITDEGRWVSQARNVAIFGSLSRDDLSLIHLAIAPAFQLVVLLNFWLFEVDYWTARLYSALCGSCILAGYWLYFRKRLTTLGLIFGMSVLALDSNMVFFSRVAIPEVSTNCWALVAFLILCSDPSSIRCAAISGFVTAIAVTMKATSAPLCLLFLIVSLLNFRENKLILNRSRGLAFTLGAMAPFVVYVAIVVRLIGFDELLPILRTIGSFLKPGSPYSVASIFLDEEYSYGVFSSLLLLAWLCGGIVLAGIPIKRTSTAVAYYGSLIWSVGWLSIPLFIDYFPERYVLQAILPLVVHVSIGISCIQTAGMTKVFCHLEGLPSRERVIGATWFALPVAILLTPLVVAVANHCGLSIDRMRERFAVIGMVCVGLAFLSYAVWEKRQYVGAVLLFPVVVALGWVFALTWRRFYWELWGPTLNAGVETWLVLLLVGTVISIAFSNYSSQRQETYTVFGYVCTIALLVSLGLQIVPTVTDRHYTIKQTAKQLQGELKESESIEARSAESLFIGNELKYNFVASGRHNRDHAESIVVAFERVPSTGIVGYELVDEYEIYVDPNYFRIRGDRTPEKKQNEVTIKVYRRND